MYQPTAPDPNAIMALMASQPVKVEHVQTVDILQDFAPPTEKAVPRLAAAAAHAGESTRLPYPMRPSDQPTTKALAEIVAASPATMTEPLVDLRINIIKYHPTKDPMQQTFGRLWGYAKGPITVRESSDESNVIALTLQPASAAATANVADKRSIEAINALNGLFPASLTPMSITGGQRSVLGQLLGLKNNPTRFLVRLAAMYLSCAMAELVGTSLTASTRACPQPAHVKTGVDYTVLLDANASMRSWAPLKLNNVSHNPADLMLPILLATSTSYPLQTRGVSLPTAAALWPEIPALRLLFIGESLPSLLDLHVTAEQVWDAAMEWCGQNSSQAAFTSIVEDLLIISMAPTAPGPGSRSYVQGVAPYYGAGGVSIGIPQAQMAQYLLAPISTQVQDWEEANNARLPPPKIDELLHKAAGDALLWAVAARMVGMTAQLTALTFDNSAAVTAPLLQSMSAQRGPVPFNIACCQMIAAYMNVSPGSVTLSPMLLRLRPQVITMHWVAGWWDNQQYAPQWSELVDVCKTLPPNAAVLPLLRPHVPDQAALNHAAAGIWHRPKMQNPTYYHIIEGLSLLAIHHPALRLGVYTYDRATLNAKVREFVPIRTYDGLPSDWQFFGPMTKGSATISIVTKWNTVMDLLTTITKCNVAAEYRLKILAKEDAAEYFRDADDPITYLPPPSDGGPAIPGAPYGTSFTGIYKPAPPPPPPVGPAPLAPAPLAGPPGGGPSDKAGAAGPSGPQPPAGAPEPINETPFVANEPLNPLITNRIMPLAKAIETACASEPLVPGQPGAEKVRLSDVSDLARALEAVGNAAARQDMDIVLSPMDNLGPSKIYQDLAYALPNKFVDWYELLRRMEFDQRAPFMAALGDVLRSLATSAPTPIHAMAIGTEGTRCAARAAALAACPAVSADELVHLHNQARASGRSMGVASAREVASALHAKRTGTITPVAVQRALIAGLPITELLPEPVSYTEKRGGQVVTHNTATAWMNGDDDNPNNRENVAGWRFGLGRSLAKLEQSIGSVEAVTRARAHWLSNAKKLAVAGTPQTWEHAVAILGYEMASNNNDYFLDAPSKRVLELVGKSEREIQEAKDAARAAGTPLDEPIPSLTELRAKSHVTMYQLLQSMRDADEDYRRRMAARRGTTDGSEATVTVRDVEPQSDGDTVGSATSGESSTTSETAPSAEIPDAPRFTVQGITPSAWGVCPPGTWTKSKLVDVERPLLAKRPWAITTTPELADGPADPISVAVLPALGEGGTNFPVPHAVEELIVRRAMLAVTPYSPHAKAATLVREVDLTLPTFYWRGTLYQFHPGIEPDVPEDEDGGWVVFDRRDVLYELCLGEVYAPNLSPALRNTYGPLWGQAERLAATYAKELDAAESKRPIPPPTPTPDLSPVGNPISNTMTKDVGQNTVLPTGEATVLATDAPEADLGTQLQLIDPNAWERVQAATADVLAEFLPSDTIPAAHIAKREPAAYRQLSRAALFATACLEDVAKKIGRLGLALSDHEPSGFEKLANLDILKEFSIIYDNLAGAYLAKDLMVGEAQRAALRTVKTPAYMQFGMNPPPVVATITAEATRAWEATKKMQSAFIVKHLMALGTIPPQTKLLPIDRNPALLPAQHAELEAKLKETALPENAMPMNWQQTVEVVRSHPVLSATYTTQSTHRLHSAGVIRNTANLPDLDSANLSKAISDAADPYDAAYQMITTGRHSELAPLMFATSQETRVTPLLTPGEGGYLFGYSRQRGLIYSRVAPMVDDDDTPPTPAPPTITQPPMSPKPPAVMGPSPPAGVPTPIPAAKATPKKAKKKKGIAKERPAQPEAIVDIDKEATTIQPPQAAQTVQGDVAAPTNLPELSLNPVRTPGGGAEKL